MQKKSKNTLPEKELLTELIMSERFACCSLNSLVGMCTSRQLREKLLELLNEEHSAAYDITEELLTRGYSLGAPADAKSIARVIAAWSEPSIVK